MPMELINKKTGRRWFICWVVRRQGSTSSSTAEAEAVAFSYATKHESIPMQMLLDAFLADCRRSVEAIAKVDSTEAITAVHEG